MKNKQRRYFLHKKLKGFLVVNSRRKEVIVSDELISSLSEDVSKFLFELRDKFGYNLQYVLDYEKI